MTNELGWLEKIVNAHWAPKRRSTIGWAYSSSLGPIHFNFPEDFPINFPEGEDLTNGNSDLITHYWATTTGNGTTLEEGTGTPPSKFTDHSVPQVPSIAVAWRFDTGSGTYVLDVGDETIEFDPAPPGPLENTFLEPSGVISCGQHAFAAYRARQTGETEDNHFVGTWMDHHFVHISPGGGVLDIIVNSGGTSITYVDGEQASDQDRTYGYGPTFQTF